MTWQRPAGGLDPSPRSIRRTRCGKTVCAVKSSPSRACLPLAAHCPTLPKQSGRQPVPWQYVNTAPDLDPVQKPMRRERPLPATFSRTTGRCQGGNRRRSPTSFQSKKLKRRETPRAAMPNHGQRLCSFDRVIHNSGDTACDDHALQPDPGSRCAVHISFPKSNPSANMRHSLYQRPGLLTHRSIVGPLVSH